MNSNSETSKLSFRRVSKQSINMNTEKVEEILNPEKENNSTKENLGLIKKIDLEKGTPKRNFSSIFPTIENNQKNLNGMHHRTTSSNMQKFKYKLPKLQIHSNLKKKEKEQTIEKLPITNSKKIVDKKKQKLDIFSLSNKNSKAISLKNDLSQKIIHISSL